MGNQESRDEAAAAPAAGGDAEPAEFDPQAVNGMSYWQMAKVGYQELVNAIIRPPRARYLPGDLGPAAFEYGGRRFQRTDLQLANCRGQRLECSHWEPVPEDRPAEALPCVIFLHGNASCRVEAVDLLSHLLAAGVTVFALDFAGSGQSEGEYVSLGFYEKDDVQAVVDHLRGSGGVSTLALWGRSMGAATSLLHGDRDPSIAAMVLDSPFADLHQLAGEMVEHGREQGFNVPGFVVKGAIKMIASSVHKTCGFHVRELSPISHADRCFIPALFVHAEGDDFIRPHHSQQIHEAYAGDKNLVLVEGDHNSIRPGFLFDSATIFLATTMQVPEELRLDVGGESVTHLPPWHRHNPTWRSRAGRAAAVGEAAEEELIRQAIAESLAMSGGAAAGPAADADAEEVEAQQDEYDEEEALRMALAASMAGGVAGAPSPVSSGGAVATLVDLGGGGDGDADGDEELPEPPPASPPAAEGGAGAGAEPEAAPPSAPPAATGQASGEAPAAAAASRAGAEEEDEDAMLARALAASLETSVGPS